MIYTSMLLALFMSMSVPGGLRRARAVIRGGVRGDAGRRSLFTAWCVLDERVLRRTFVRIASIWLAVSGVVWIVGGLLEGEARLAVWLAALGIEYLGPVARYWTPFHGASTTDWDVRGEHIAERCGLFVIICLGETLLISGATFVEAEWTREGIAAFAVNFLGVGGDVVALLQHRAGAGCAGDRTRGRPGAGGEDSLHLRAHPDRGRHRGERGRGRAGDRAPDGPCGLGARRRRSSVGRHFSWSAISGSRG